jgi:hypothetical protein
MSELPLQCSFPLTKVVCCYSCVSAEHDIPAIDALYHPELYTEFFHSSDSVCEWLSAVFCAASAENVPFMTYFSCNEFVVCNLAHRSTINLSGLDVSSSIFHPWSLLKNFVILSSAENHPVWFYYQKNHYLASLMQLSRTELVCCLKSLGIPYTTLSGKSGMSSRVFQEFLDCRNKCMTKSTAELITDNSLDKAVSPTSHNSEIYYLIFKNQFGNTVTNALLIPENVYHNTGSSSTSIAVHDSVSELEEQLLSLTNTNSDLLPSSSSLPKSVLKSVLSHIHVSRQPSFQRSHASHAVAIVKSFRSRCMNLLPCTLTQIIQYIKCFEPFFQIPASFLFRDAVIYLLNLEYSPAIVVALTKPANIRRNENLKFSCAKELHSRIVSNAKHTDNIVNNWPTLPDDEVIYDCLRSYRNATNLSVSKTCTCCSRSNQSTMEDILLQNFDDVYDSLNLHLLQCKNPLLLAAFVSLPQQLQHLMLDIKGMTVTVVEGNVELSKSILHLCEDCHTQLQKNKMPRFALANNLFRGELPEQFKDLTWIEEMTCAIYRCTAHVSCLYQSSDPAQPCIFHGNTRAHDMNVVSTASVLPRTPDHINEMLSVVFIGPGKYKKDCLKNMFRIRKKKSMGFLSMVERYC